VTLIFPVVPEDMTLKYYSERCTLAALFILNSKITNTYKFAKDWNEQVGVARAYLEKASKKMKN